MCVCVCDFFPFVVVYIGYDHTYTYMKSSSLSLSHIYIQWSKDLCIRHLYSEFKTLQVQVSEIEKNK